MKFNTYLNHMSPSASMKIGLNDNITGYTNFAIGAPDIEPPVEVIEIIRSRVNSLKYPYTATTGTQAARENIAFFLSDSENEIQSDQVLLCEGAKLGIYLTLKTICQKGDKVMIIEPYWLSYPQIIASLELQTIFFTPLLNQRGVLLYDYNELIRIAIMEKVSAVIINNPNNPSGQIIKNADIDSIAKQLNDAEIWLIIDEVYKELIFEESNKESFNIKGQNVIRIGSFSKSLCIPGLRLGYIVSNPENLIKISLLNQHIQTCVNSYALAVAENIHKTTVIRHSGYCSNIYKLRYIALKKCCESSKLTLLQCDSSFYAFVDFSEYFINAIAACDFLFLNHKVLATPGNEYGESFNSFVRICLTLPEADISKKFNRIINEGF